MILSPRPSIFKAFLETKCLIISISCAGHFSPFLHLKAAAPSSLYKEPPQEGHLLGFLILFFLLPEPLMSTLLI